MFIYRSILELLVAGGLEGTPVRLIKNDFYGMGSNRDYPEHQNARQNRNLQGIELIPMG